MTDKFNYGEPNLWFVDKPVEVALFRINRRDLDPQRPSIIPKYSDDLLTHITAVLELAGTVSSRKGGREWNIGNVVKHTDDDESALSARIGGVITELTMNSKFDEESKSWKDEPVEVPHSVVTGIAILGKTRLVGIASVPGVSPNSIAKVLARALNDGERELEIPVTDWCVDPVISEVGFWTWVEKASQVNEVKSVFARPNPDGADDWQAEMDRLDALEAQTITETVKAMDKDRGLNKSALKHDGSFNSMVAAAKKSWATITAKGVVDDREETYSQEKSVASERMTGRADSWPIFLAGIIDATLRGRRKMK